MKGKDKKKKEREGGHSKGGCVERQKDMHHGEERRMTNGTVKG